MVVYKLYSREGLWEKSLPLNVQQHVLSNHSDLCHHSSYGDRVSKHMSVSHGCMAPSYVENIPLEKKKPQENNMESWAASV